MHFADLQALSDQGSLYAYLSQRLLSDHLDERLGEYTWDADLEAKRLSFVAVQSDARIDTSVELVATIAPGPRSMLWGWAHPESSGELAGQLRAYGEAHGIPSLTSPEVALPTDATGPALLAEIEGGAHTIGSVVVAVTGQAPYYSAPVQGGTRAVFLLTGYDFPRPRIDHQLPLRVPQALQAGTIHDQRAAVYWLAARCGWQIEPNADWSEVRLTDPGNGNSATARFDPLARLTGLQMTLSPQ